LRAFALVHHGYVDFVVIYVVVVVGEGVGVGAGVGFGRCDIDCVKWIQHRVHHIDVVAIISKEIAVIAGGEVKLKIIVVGNISSGVAFSSSRINLMNLKSNEKK
jgi:hypothetical protein